MSVAPRSPPSAPPLPVSHRRARGSAGTRAIRDLDLPSWRYRKTHEYSPAMSGKGPRRRLRRCRCARVALAPLILAGLLSIAMLVPAAQASLRERDGLIYMPYGLVHFVRPASEVDGYLAEVDAYGIGQLVFAMPKFKPSRQGALKVPRHNAQMLAEWVSRANAYDAEHGAQLSITAVFNGKVSTKKSGLNLDDAPTRANLVAGVEASLALGISGVQLDLEPYPTTPGFITLLEQLDAMFARVGFDGHFSVTAPATTTRWSPSYLARVSQLVTQLDPLYYDSELTTTSAYETWVEDSLAYYTANTAAACRIVPVLPSYSADKWHLPSVEDVEHASSALSAALDAGARVNGAGIWSGWGFLLDEEGGYDGSGDRAAWQSTTVGLPFSA
jgi:hypothetical protein